MKYHSFAKVNLALDLIEREKNGYHLMQTVLQEIPLFDEIDIKQSDKNIVQFEGEEAELIDVEDNTLIQVFDLLKLKNYYNVVVTKKIPVGAGLGGGSSNAAALLKALNKIEELNLSNDELRELGAKIGMDVPFFIEGGTSLGTHYGEKIKLLPPLNSLPNWQQLHKLLIIPEQRKNTESMFNKVNTAITNKNTDKTKQLIAAINNNDTKQVIENMHNDFELFTDQTFNKIPHSILCGAGTTTFAVSNNPFDVKALSQELPHQHILNLTQ